MCEWENVWSHFWKINSLFYEVICVHIKSYVLLSFLSCFRSWAEWISDIFPPSALLTVTFSVLELHLWLGQADLMLQWAYWHLHRRAPCSTVLEKRPNLISKSEFTGVLTLSDCVVCVAVAAHSMPRHLEAMIERVGGLWSHSANAAAARSSRSL